jgi:hypothetical protein
MNIFEAGRPFLGPRALARSMWPAFVTVVVFMVWVDPIELPSQYFPYKSRLFVLWRFLPGYQDPSRHNWG